MNRFNLSHLAVIYLGTLCTNQEVRYISALYILMAIRKTNILIILLIISNSFSLFGQKQYYIDSLNKSLTTSVDSQKIATYNALSWAYKFSNATRAYEYAKKSNTLSKTLNNAKGEAISLNRMSAAKLILGELNLALKYSLSAKEISATYNYYRIQSTSLRQIGNVYEAQGNDSQAMKYYYKSLSIADSIGTPIHIARSALYVAGLHIKIDNYYNANHYLNYAIEEFNKDKFLRGLHQAYVMKGDYSFKQNKLDSALINYTTALTYLDKLKDKQGYATAKLKIANVHESKGHYKEALEGYYIALDTFKIIDNKKEIVITNISLASTYLKNSSPTKAISHANLALKQAINQKFPNEQKEANYILYIIYKKIGEKETALLYLEDYMHLMDSLNGKQESWRVDQMKQSFEIELKINEQKLTSATINNQALIIENNRLLRNFLIVLVFTIILLASFIWFALRKAKTANKNLALANEEKNDAISLISHDLKSPFNKIKGLGNLLKLELSDANTSVKEIISKINLIAHEGLSLVQNLVDIKALTSGSYHLKHTSFDLATFLQKRVLDFEQVAYVKNITLIFAPLKRTCEVQTDLNSVARIFDNLMSNAIKFSPTGEQIKIDCDHDGANFYFTVSDNGIGISEDAIDSIFKKYKTGNALPTGTELSNGLGLAITSSLIRKLGGSISCNSTLGKGASFKVALPL